MLKSLRSLLILSALAVPFMGDHPTPVYSQEYQGCYMVDAYGNFTEYDEMCPIENRIVVSTTDSEGLGTGDIQVTLRWATTDDLDLAVTDPDGNTIYFGNRNSPSGGELDVDANAACSGSTSTPIENIYWPVSQAPQGNYTASVNLFTRCSGGGAGAIPFELRLLVQGETETLTGTVDDQTQTASFPFSLPR